MKKRIKLVKSGSGNSNNPNPSGSTTNDVLTQLKTLNRSSTQIQRDTENEKVLIQKHEQILKVELNKLDELLKQNDTRERNFQRLIQAQKQRTNSIEEAKETVQKLKEIHKTEVEKLTRGRNLHERARKDFVKGMKKINLGFSKDIDFFQPKNVQNEKKKIITTYGNVNVEETNAKNVEVNSLKSKLLSLKKKKDFLQTEIKYLTSMSSSGTNVNDKMDTGDDFVEPLPKNVSNISSLKSQIQVTKNQINELQKKISSAKKEMEECQTEAENVRNDIRVNVKNSGNQECLSCKCHLSKDFEKHL